jgi:N-acetylmuramoyl-L-alanine amidase
MLYDFRRVVISSGHGKYIRGASDLPEGLDEVDCARELVELMAIELRNRGCEVVTFHDDTSHDQSTNLSTIVAAHNRENRQLDISCHFNAYEHTESKFMGTEVLYYSEAQLAADLSRAIASVGFPDRGPKQRTDLAFLRNTTEPAVLLEICFVDSMPDAELYRRSVDAIAENIAAVLTGDETITPMPPEPEALFYALGKCSEFGGPADSGMTESEGLAFLYQQSDKPEVFLPGKALSSPALGRDLNPETHYLAVRWDYDSTPKSMLAGDQVALVRNAATGFALTAMPADWGPAGPESDHDTGRIADLSPSLMRDLQLTTDDDVEIIYPFDPNQGV